MVFAVFFLAPGFPHDILCYIAGITDIDFKKILAVVSLGRLPTLIVLVVTGESIASSNIIPAFVILSTFMITGFLAVENERKLIKHAKNLLKDKR